MQIQQALDEYEYAILQLSDCTQLWYRKRVGRFAFWCDANGFQLADLRPTHVARYLRELATIPSETTGTLLSTYTVNGHARAIRTFLYWCASDPQNYLPRSIPENLAMPKIQQKIIEVFSAQQIKALFLACEKETSPLLVHRNKAILAVLIDTGIRAAELCTLTRQNVHIMAREGYIRVTGKGDKEREIPLGAKSRQLLHKWLSQYRHNQGSDYPEVFLNYRGEHLTPNGLDQMIYELADRATITGVRCSAHTFRHTFALNFLMQGGDVYVLSRLMGHSSVQTTEVYLRALKADQARKAGKSVLDNL